MKKIKISVLCVLLAVAMTVAVFTLEYRGSTDGTFQADSGYIPAENLALQKGGEAILGLSRLNCLLAKTGGTFNGGA